MTFGAEDDMTFEVRQNAGIITLQRPKALNAITDKMVIAIDKALDAWEKDTRVHHIVIKAEGRAFSAGGDLLELYDMAKSGHLHFDFFRDEYSLNARLGVFPKPIVALINGIIMGGGVGVAVHGKYRVMSENAVFAMPEVGIGFFPDVGGSHFLPRLPNNVGRYLALTGARIKAADALACGIATHYVAADNLDVLEAALCEEEDAGAVLDRLDDRQNVPAGRLDQAEINRLFSGGSVKAIMQDLAAAEADSDLARTALEAMKTKSPTSMSVAYRQLEEGRDLSLAECMRMEFRILVRMLRGHEFTEGIRAVIVDKSNNPIWHPQTIDEVTEADVAAYFEPLGEDELTDMPGRAMSDLTEPSAPRPSMIELAFDIFHRIVAILCLIAGLRYWSLIIGMGEGGAWRFDLLPVHWKIVAASLAVLWPVAGIGLWMIVSWGPVVWLVAAMTEVIMHGLFPELYGYDWTKVGVHVAIAVLYGAFRLVLYLIHRKAEQAE